MIVGRIIITNVAVEMAVKGRVNRRFNIASFTTRVRFTKLSEGAEIGITFPSK
jgi:hypothetical protein